MPEPDLHRLIAEAPQANAPFATALVLTAEGSTPARTGARALIDSAGHLMAGTIGGGAVEAEAMRVAAQALQSRRPAVFEFRMQDERTPGAGPICGGTMRILVDPNPALRSEAYRAALAARARRESGVLLTCLGDFASPDPQSRWLPATAIDSHPGFPGAERLRETLARESPRFFTLASGTTERGAGVFVEPILAAPLLLIVGGGHVGQAVAWQAGRVGFEVVVIDDRPEFTRSELFPAGTLLRCADPVAELASLPLTRQTFIVLVTRGHVTDGAALAACIRAPVAYLGMIGSRRKIKLLREEFLARGQATEPEFDQVYAPIGLDLGAITVPEIATSIVAQLIAVRRTGSASRLYRADRPPAPPPP